jgi:cyclic beta-1,2-glucan synthetase
MLDYRSTERALIVRRNDGEFRGEMALSCDTDCVMTADREGFFAGEVSGEVRPFAGSCAAVTARVKLPAHSVREVRFTLCYSASDAPEMSAAAEKADPGDFMPRYELHPTIKSGSDTLDRLFNVWLPWQILGCRMRARSGFYQNGGAYGFRDQLQDCTAAVYFMPSEARRHILRSCSAQFVAGDVLHWWHETGAGRKGIRTRCSDDMLWLPYAAAHFVRVTGDDSLLSAEVPYAAGEELGGAKEKYMQVAASPVSGTVYEHCVKALDRCYRTGPHSLIKIGGGDWNDGFNRVGEDGMGESVWLSMFYVAVVRLFAPLARSRGDDAYAAVLEKRASALSAAAEDSAFENGYYLRAFYDNGAKMGAAENECCKIDLLPQAFAELAGLPDREKRRSALKAALDRLYDGKHGIIKLFDPPFTPDSAEDPGYVRGYPPGVRENGGQYTHAAVWLALAFLRSGDRDTAEKLAKALDPAARGGEYKNEPCYMSADICTAPGHYGRGGWSLYTGSAAWYYRLLGELYGGF